MSQNSGSGSKFIVFRSIKLSPISVAEPSLDDRFFSCLTYCFPRKGVKNLMKKAVLQGGVRGDEKKRNCRSHTSDN